MTQCSHCHHAPPSGSELGIDSNYFSPPLEEHRQYSPRQDPPRPPERDGQAPWTIDVGRAKLTARLVPRSFTVSLPWESNAKLRVGSEGSVTSEFEIIDNRIPLLMQSLLNFHDLHVTGPMGLEFSPDRLGVGDYGVLHFLTKVPPPLYRDAIESDFSLTRLLLDFLVEKNWVRILSPPYGPQGTFPLGREDPPALSATSANPIPQTLLWHDLTECCPQPVDSSEAGGLGVFACMKEDHPIPFCRGWEFPDPEENPKLDFALEHQLPEELLGPQGRLPEDYELNHLSSQISRLMEKPRKPSLDLKEILRRYVTLDDPEGPAENLLALLKEGDIQLDLEALNDLFIPGVLDLGKSSGDFFLRLSEDGQIHLDGENLAIQLDAMDYPTGPGKSPLLQIHKGHISSGTPYTDPRGRIWEPGIQLEWDPQKEAGQVRVKVDVSVQLSLPLLGSVTLQTPLLAETGLRKRGSGPLHPVPGTSALQLPQLKIVRDHPAFPLNTQLRVVLSDQSEFQSPHFSELEDSVPHFNLRLQGPLGNLSGTEIDLDGYVPMTLDTLGRYDFKDSLRSFEWESSLKIKNARGPEYETLLSLYTFRPPENYFHTDSGEFGFRADLEIQRDGRDWILEEGNLFFERIRGENGKQIHLLHAQGKTLDLGEISLRDFSAATEINLLPAKDGKLRLHFPQFEISANPRGAPSGWLQGPISLKLIKDESAHRPPLPCDCEPPLPGRRDRTLQISWDPEHHLLELSHLNLSVNAQGIRLPKFLENRQRKALRQTRSNGEKAGPSAAGIGVDGKIRGKLQFDFENWRGSGALVLRGDRDGDVYFHNSKGQKIFPPLIRLTQWRFNRFDKFLLNKGYVYGAYRLFYRINTQSLKKFGYQIDYESDIWMTHGDVPLKPGGIDAANEAYYERIFKEAMARGGLEFLLEDFRKGLQGEKQP